MGQGWRLLVFQHIECEHPGSLREGLKADGVDWTVVELDAGDAIPPLSARYPIDAIEIGKSADDEMWDEIHAGTELDESRLDDPDWDLDW